MAPSPTLDEVLADAPGLRVRSRVGRGDVVITSVVHDTRQVAPGALFCAIRGEHVDGHDLVPAAVEAGAVAVLVDREVRAPSGVSQVLVEDTRVAMGPVAAAFHGRPSEHLTVVGVTGTNGKTTTTHLLASIFEHAGHRTGLLGTLTGTHTTPEATELQARLAAFRADGCTHVAMEVSSHALALHRVDGTRFAVAVFTNLGRDHLDFHGTVERYFAAKARLFEPGLSAVGVVDVDDPHGRLLADAAPIPITPFAVDDADDVVVGPTSCSFRWRGRQVQLPLGGRFNVANALAAATAAVVAGISEDDVVAGLEAAPPVPGRFEPVDAGQPFTVIVDYAHKPEALAEVLRTAREVAAPGGRVLVVFGAGGDRDTAKRPLLGEAAAELADVAVVTSDNPRSEDPAAIIDAVLSGVPPRPVAAVRTEIDRRRAIGLALDLAAPGDVVVVAGKGHETTQTTGTTVVDFDDRVVVRELLGRPA